MPVATANELIVAANEVGAKVAPFLLGSALKGVVVLAAAWLIVRSMRRTSAARRHLVWVLAIIGLIALPVLTAVLPRWNVLPHQTLLAEPARVEPVHVTRPAALAIERVTTSAAPPARSTSAAVTTDARESVPRAAAPSAPPVAATPSPPPSLSPPGYVLLAWAAGCIVALVPVALGAWALWRLRRCARPLEDASWQASLAECARRLNVT